MSDVTCDMEHRPGEEEQAEEGRARTPKTGDLPKAILPFDSTCVSVCFISFLFFPEKASVSPSHSLILTEKVFPSYPSGLTPSWLLPQTVDLHLLMGLEPISLNSQGILACPGEKEEPLLPGVVQPGLTFTSSSCLPSAWPHFSSLCCYCLPFPPTSPLFSHVHTPLLSLAPAPAPGHVA